MGYLGVRKNGFLTLVRLFEEIVEAFSLRPADSKVEVAFTVLAHVFNGAIRTLEAHLEIFPR